MKTRTLLKSPRSFGTATVCGLLLLLNAQFPVVFAQGTAFTYQGRLTDNGSSATGHYDMLFSLYDAASGGNQVDGTLMGSAVPVTNGLFTISLDFGSGIFTGPGRWLKIDVRTNGGGAYAPLSPRQALTAAPYAVTAGQMTGNLPAGQVSGTLALGQMPVAVVTNTQAGVSLSGAFTGNGAGVSNVNALTLGGLGPTNFWRTGGNAGTTAGANFLGTTDNQALEFRVNNTRVLRLGPNTNGSPNVIGGSPVNFLGADVIGATIAGGGATNDYGLDIEILTNSIRSSYGVICGGVGNSIDTNAIGSTIAGGADNVVSSGFSTIAGGVRNFTSGYSSAIAGGELNSIIDTGDSVIGGGFANGVWSDPGSFTVDSVVGGGSYNRIYSSDYSAILCGLENEIHFSTHSAIGGGIDNFISFSTGSTIAGGAGNYLGSNSLYSVIGGGIGNIVPANAPYAVIPGGQSNTATNCAFAAGSRAKALNSGAFVWGDSTDADVSSSTNDQFTARASGGVRFFSNTNLTAGVFLAPGGTAWGVISDRNAKKDFTPVDSQAVLEKLAALPITQWHYKWEEQDATPHIGPMAQDFKAAFYPGADDKTITTQEADGVALAAIQGLNQKLTDELEQKQTEIAELRRSVAELTRMVGKLASEPKGEAK